MNGVLVVDKPSGPTSHDVVARVRRALGERRIGHTGTLDPLATGVLPLVIGQATRLASFLSGAEKTYEAGVRLGVSTDSYDALGRVVPTGEPVGATPPPDSIDAAAVEAALGAFRGSYLQTPPAFSAKKIGGVAAHRLARRDQAVQPSAVPVTVRELTLVDYDQGLARLRVTSSAGFYVRTLAHELGAALGCGAHLESLRRTRSGGIGLDRAVPLEVVEREGSEAAGRLIPLGQLLPEVPSVVLTESGAVKTRHGNDLAPADVVGEMPDAPQVRLLDASGELLAVASRKSGGVLHPSIVLV
jgi:tRNA pseudouridine55 synthase